MTPAELKHYRKSLGLSVEAFARAVGVMAGRTVRRWEDGTRDIPGPVIVLLELAKKSQTLRRKIFTV
ncbi:MAG: helix-turn-helix domain-containing protein [Anaerolineales bacterium]